MSSISERLLENSRHLGGMPSGALLLNDNAHYPWFILVPGGNFVEWMDLPEETQVKLLADLNSLSRFLREDRLLGVEKINVGAIGNIVPQFHLHVLGRREDDPAWPGPVWGHPDFVAYGEGQVESLSQRLAEAIPDFSHGS